MAERIGAANTLVRQPGGGLKAYNTDWSAAISAVETGLRGGSAIYTLLQSDSHFSRSRMHCCQEKSIVRELELLAFLPDPSTCLRQLSHLSLQVRYAASRCSGILLAEGTS